jgi:hypothetical protein
MELKPVEHWGVDIRINGERVLSIESNSLSGIENISDYADTVRTCAEHLLAFIGNNSRSPVACPHLDNVGGCVKTVGHTPCTCREQNKDAPVEKPSPLAEPALAEMLKHSDIDTIHSNLFELLRMIDYKNDDMYIQSMRQYIVNPIAWIITEKAARTEKPFPVAEGKFEDAKEYLEKSLIDLPYKEVEETCGAGIMTTLFYLEGYAKIIRAALSTRREEGALRDKKFIDTIEYCKTLSDIIDICGKKTISFLDKERIYVKSGNIFDTLGNLLNEWLQHRIARKEGV